MNNFPEFMKQPANRIAATSQATAAVEGYMFDGVDGSQMAFWTCPQNTSSVAHDYDEYMLVVQGRYTLVINGERILLKLGKNILFLAARCTAEKSWLGTRTIHAFGGHRADRSCR